MPTRKLPSIDSGRSCRQCDLFEEATERTDDVEWGYCHLNPQHMVIATDEGGEPDAVPVKAWVILPWWCSNLKPKQ